MSLREILSEITACTVFLGVWAAIFFILLVGFEDADIIAFFYSLSGSHQTAS